MKLTTSLRLIFVLSSLLCGFVTHAQNANREEEEKQIEAARKEKVEETIHAREEEAKQIEQNPELYEHPEEKNLVEVEPNNILPADLSNVSALIPYRIRRQPTGADVGLSLSTYKPVHYTSTFISNTLSGGDYNSLYGTPDVPMMELYFNYKKNMSFGSAGLEVGAGFFKSSVTTDGGDHLTFSMQQYRLGGKLILDTIGYEPKLAPYVGGGVYTVVFKEDNESTSLNGNTEVAYYYYAGLMAQLNWIDPSSAVEAYSEAGIENTFLFAEVRQYMASANDQDPDFSSGIIFNAGISLEF